jgi:hypothetical protein
MLGHRRATHVATAPLTAPLPPLPDDTAGRQARR